MRLFRKRREWFGAPPAHWQRAAEALGLTLSWGSNDKRLVGLVDELLVQCTPMKHMAFATIRVHGRGTIPGALSISSESVLTRTLASADIETGHNRFDHLVRVKGDELIAPALLDHRTRLLVLREVVDRGATVEDGSVSATEVPIASLVERVTGLVELARRLVMAKEDVLERLVENARGDEHPVVRLRSLILLQERFRGTSTALEQSRFALESPFTSIRLAGALYLGQEGLETLQNIASDERGDEDLRVKALRGLARPSWAERAVPVCEALLESTSLPVRKAAIESIGRFRHRPALERLVALAGHRGVPTAEAETVAHALQRIGDPAAEPCLLRLLGFTTSPAAPAAARALGRVGTVAAVEPLHGLTRGLATPGNIKRAASEAIARIQARLGDVEAGRLSLARPADYEGGLSVASHPEHSGALSLEPEEESQT